jgi:hypothetical protein
MWSPSRAASSSICRCSELGANGRLLIGFSASHHLRVNALVLVNCYAHYVREEDVDLDDKSPSFQVRSM